MQINRFHAQFGQLTTRTGFKNLGDRAVTEHPDEVKKEKHAAQLDSVPVDADRRWYYWKIAMPKGLALPADKALDLNRRMGEDVRAFGHAGGMDEQTLKNWMEGANNGVTSWHVDTQEGLRELVTVLREHFQKLVAGLSNPSAK